MTNKESLPIQPFGKKEDTNTGKNQSIQNTQNQTMKDEKGYHINDNKSNTYKNDDPLGLLSSTQGLIPPIYLLVLTLKRMIRRFKSRVNQR